MDISQQRPRRSATWTVLFSAALCFMLISTSLAIADNSNSIRQSAPLAPVSAFMDIVDNEERAIAIFEEMAKAFLHPRCLNCHTSTDRPFQGDVPYPHVPRVTRGDSDIGVTGMYCTTCHQERNAYGVPGNGAWLMAPISMGWTGLSTPELCRHLKDRNLNGDRTPEEIAIHIEEEHLLGFAWTPPVHLEPTPGSREELGALAHAWADAGAGCPADVQ